MNPLNTKITHMLTILGNGNEKVGYARMVEICKRLKYAREKHSWDGYKPLDGYTAISCECCELGLAVMQETPERQHDEALDVIATAIRFANKEWKV